VVARVLAILTAFACSGKPRPDQSTHVAARDDAAAIGEAISEAIDEAIDEAVPAVDARAARPATGDLQIRVEWPDVPVAARNSPGRTPCHTPRTPSVAPTTTWGIPDALVIVDGARPLLASARITLASCTLTPRIAAAGALAITSAVDHPAKLVLRKRGTVATLGHLATGEAIPVLLPITGHTVTAALDAGAIYSLETEAADPEVAFIAAIPGGYVTDASGQVIARDLSAGPHTVTAWLPPRAGQPARTGRGTATVASGELTALTITLAP
jgi:hypothetical protein